MKLYMLDTNTVSHLLRGHPVVTEHIVAVPMASLCISAITAGELLFGLAKRPAAKRLHLAVRQFLLRVDVLPWNSSTAEHYGIVRADMEKRGRILASLDLLIAAHALSVGATLVTNDKAFSQIADLQSEDWSV
ncbi:type II toxin-antitoxin system VapC family toxin [Acidithiobacillus montserratensis]|uniref:Type II toxin-antitoxin system VapC family toxin n=1 Tax=Acidithiobacillus montserratensis TaxID=2729135 RepID=A0ACD5HJP1_9PROT|nr:type II toxin-antitoxin system VapC family toxin [Acidithiobacillaceae bacterium]MBU2748694.1 type II toxin-antitoxin system VapC family toxin [Acidithiobacillus montserratensis]